MLIGDSFNVFAGSMGLILSIHCYSMLREIMLTLLYIMLDLKYSIVGNLIKYLIVGSYDGNVI